MKKSCKEIRDLLPLYVDNMTTQIESSIIKEHLEICAECRREYDFIKSIVATAATLPLIKPSEGFNDKLHLKLVEEKNKNRKKMLSKFQKISVAALSSAAVIAISVVSLNVLDEKKMIDEPIPPIASTAPFDITTETTEDTPAEDGNISEPNESPAPNDKKADATTSPDKKDNASSDSKKVSETTEPDSKKADATTQSDDNTKNTVAPADNNAKTPNGRRTTPSSRGENQHSKTPEQTATNEKSNSSSSRSSEPDKSDSNSTTTSEREIYAFASPSIAKSYDDAPKSSGGNSGGSASARTSVPSKVKVTVNVSVKDSDISLAKQMLSGYTYSNGAYVLSSSEYYQVGAKLDALGATSSITREDKTSTYADLQSQLENASGSKATSIQNQMNKIDSEVSKTYVILN